jgi:hypothetical protein
MSAKARFFRLFLVAVPGVAERRLISLDTFSKMGCAACAEQKLPPWQI